jgi:hypothetical protein
MRDPKRLNRLLRVRAVQRDIAEAQEMQARNQALNAEGLVRRIDQLVADVTPGEGLSSGIALASGAAFRGRLSASRDDAANRLSTAEALLARREDDTRTALRDMTAMEKLVERGRARAAADELRRLVDQMPSGKTGTKFADQRDGKG